MVRFEDQAVTLAKKPTHRLRWTTKVVRRTDGGLLHTDGPYLDSKEHIGGFWILEVADEAEALAWAEKGATACLGDVEVRPFQGMA